MQYFCNADERKGTCYHEFYRGKWDGSDFWNEKSVLIHDDVLRELELYRAFEAVIPVYDYFGKTEITQKEWMLIQQYTRDHLSGKAQEALDEIIGWIDDTFLAENVVTILGI